MGVAPQGGFRSFRTRTISMPKDARGAAPRSPTPKAARAITTTASPPTTFYNAAGQITWPEQGDYAVASGRATASWPRSRGLEGRRLEEQQRSPARRISPRPQRQPGLPPSSSSHARGGDEGAWDHMGIGEKPGDSDMSRVV